ncbi:MAG: hypothetical protein Q4E59_00620 [Bacteroidales bacterium]|nr:hypothetical protein [Bacteroidales bacterium]
MKKIMFNDRYGLTQAVLHGRKTMTRRLITCPREFKGEWVAGFSIHKYKGGRGTEVWMHDADEAIMDGGQLLPKYKVGEVVAIAQAYNELDIFRPYPVPAGWTNKMFVKADLMPHRLQITAVKVERLQEISDEDCLKEGICAYLPHYFYDYEGSNDYGFNTPREAFAALIDKVSGKGTWNSNPWVWAYEFQLLRD